MPPVARTTAREPVQDERAARVPREDAHDASVVRDELERHRTLEHGDPAPPGERAAPGRAPPPPRSRRARAAHAPGSAPPRGPGRAGRSASRSKRAPSDSSSTSRSGPSLVSRATAAASASSPATASVSRACSAGESPGPTAPAIPPWAHGLLPVWPTAPRASRSTRRPARPSATASPATPAPITTTSASRTASMRALIDRLRGRRPASARPRGAPARRPPGRPRTRCSIAWSACRIFGSVMRFMCGQRLQGRTNSICGNSTATLSAIEHSVTSTTRAGRRCAQVPDHARGRADVVGGLEHVGRTLGVRQHRRRPGAACGSDRISSPVKRSCTSQWPFHRMISVFVRAATYFPRYSSGRKITRGTPQRLDHLDRVRRGAADVRLGLHLGRGVDVGHDRSVRDSARAAAARPPP